MKKKSENITTYVPFSRVIVDNKTRKLEWGYESGSFEDAEQRAELMATGMKASTDPNAEAEYGVSTALDGVIQTDRKLGRI